MGIGLGILTLIIIGVFWIAYMGKHQVYHNWEKTGVTDMLLCENTDSGMLSSKYRGGGIGGVVLV